MTIELPLWMQVPTYPARIDRTLFAQLWDEGVLDLGAFKVSPRAAGANFTIDVSIGEAVVQGDDQTNQGNYLVRATAIESGIVIAPAPGANSRYDIVSLKINDVNAGGSAGNNATIVVTTGVVSATPSIPVVPASALLLAVIGPIVATTPSISNALIADARLVAGRRATPGDIQWTANSAPPSGWLFAGGQAISRAVYPRLFAHIGTTFGAGDGASTFNVPDLKGRTAVGLDNMGGTADAGRLDVANTLGIGLGEQYHVITLAELAVHTHAANAHSHAQNAHSHSSPGHSHIGSDHGHSVDRNLPGGSYFMYAAPSGIAVGNGGALAFYVQMATDTGWTSLNGRDTFPASASIDQATALNQNATVGINNAGSGTPANNMQPSLLLNALIRT